MAVTTADAESITASKNIRRGIPSDDNLVNDINIMDRISPLLTDFYQLTMANAYLHEGMAERPAAFQLFFRRPPFGSTFALACGLHDAARVVEEFRFEQDEIQYLRELRTPDGAAQFGETFLRYLQNMQLSVNIDAVSEGTPIFPQEPIVRVSGPLLQCQLLESILLNIINFQTLIATKAARVRFAAKDDQVIEFGLRRAQGVDGGMSASRAAFVGGCDATSNTLAGMRFDIPAKGTMAHSFVMAYFSEREAFEAYVRALPHNSTLLVDTYDTMNGINSAINVAKSLRAKGIKLGGIRLDSGDVLALSKAGRVLLDQAGFRDAIIVASGDLDEYEIERLKQNGAPIDVWGVGTRLVTGFDDPALGGIYKLVAISGDDQKLIDRMKFSNDPKKATLPGILDTRRYFKDNAIILDLIFSPDTPISQETLKMLPKHDRHEVLLKPLFKKGKRIGEQLPLKDIRTNAMLALEQLPEHCRRLGNPSSFRVDVDQGTTAKVQQFRSQYESTHCRGHAK